LKSPILTVSNKFNPTCFQYGAQNVTYSYLFHFLIVVTISLISSYDFYYLISDVQGVCQKKKLKIILAADTQK